MNYKNNTNETNNTWSSDFVDGLRLLHYLFMFLICYLIFFFFIKNNSVQVVLAGGLQEL